MYLKLFCSCCGSEGIPERKVESGFLGITYDSMLEWLKCTEKIPKLEENIWSRSERVPTMGESYVVKAYFPFHFELGEEFSVLFQPALSFFNGWDEYPDEIEESAIVKCEFMEVMDSGATSAWIRVKVVDVLMVGDICSTFVAVPYQGDVEWLESDVFDTYEFGNWVFRQWSAQGDLGEWYLIYKDVKGLKHIVLYGRWDYHSDNVYYGNVVFDTRREKNEW